MTTRVSSITGRPISPPELGLLAALPPLPLSPPSEPAAFWGRVSVAGAHWIYTGPRGHDPRMEDQYRIFVEPGSRRRVRAHRYSWELLVGPLRPDDALDHLCCAHPCVYPVHLDPCSAAENHRRKVRVAQGCCAVGHLAGSPHPACRACLALPD